MRVRFTEIKQHQASLFVAFSHLRFLFVFRPPVKGVGGAEQEDAGNQKRHVDGQSMRAADARGHSAIEKVVCANPDQDHAGHTQERPNRMPDARAVLRIVVARAEGGKATWSVGRQKREGKRKERKNPKPRERRDAAGISVQRVEQQADQDAHGEHGRMHNRVVGHERVVDVCDRNLLGPRASGGNGHGEKEEGDGGGDDDDNNYNNSSPLAFFHPETSQT